MWLAVWVVGAVLLYKPFHKWVATAENPGISAALWPLMVVFFVVFILFSAITAAFERIKR